MATSAGVWWVCFWGLWWWRLLGTTWSLLLPWGIKQTKGSLLPLSPVCGLCWDGTDVCCVVASRAAMEPNSGRLVLWVTTAAWSGALVSSPQWWQHPAIELESKTQAHRATVTLVFKVLASLQRQWLQCLKLKGMWSSHRARACCGCKEASRPGSERRTYADQPWMAPDSRVCVWEEGATSLFLGVVLEQLLWGGGAAAPLSVGQSVGGCVDEWSSFAGNLQGVCSSPGVCWGPQQQTLPESSNGQATGDLYGTHCAADTETPFFLCS